MASQASHAPASQGGESSDASLLGLPPELRILIYEHLLAALKPVTQGDVRTHRDFRTRAKPNTDPIS